jgi:hypothetical protein
MGLPDSIDLDQPRACPECGTAIKRVLLSWGDKREDFTVGDCVSHAEHLGVAREQLYCLACGALGHFVYLGIFRGLLVGIGDSSDEAKRLLDDVNLEKILFWHHDLFRKYRLEQRARIRLEDFLADVAWWFGEPDAGYLPCEGNAPYLEGAMDALDAVKRFLDDKKTLKENDGEGPIF